MSAFYAPDVLRVSREKCRACANPRMGIVEGLEKQLREMREESVVGKTAYLYPSCDPYPKGCDTSVTREVIQCLKRHGCHVRILTKRDGARDADLLDMNDCYGVTMDGDREQWDRDTMTYGGLSGEELFESLKLVHKRANTWISFEPVLDAQMLLWTLRAMSGYSNAANGYGATDAYAAPPSDFVPDFNEDDDPF